MNRKIYVNSKTGLQQQITKLMIMMMMIDIFLNQLKTTNIYQVIQKKIGNKKKEREGDETLDNRIIESEK